MDTPIIEKVIQHLQSLPQELQWRVLEFTRALALSTPQGVPGQQLLKFAGGISQEDLKKMRETIDQGCEQVDSDNLILVTRDAHFREIDNLSTDSWQNKNLR